MSKHWKYLKYVLRHKWFVLYAGVRWVRAPFWRLLIHDLSKFRPSEWFPYADNFYGTARADAYDRAWLLHQHRNLHHWQCWILREDKPPVQFSLRSHNTLTDYFIQEEVDGRSPSPALFLEGCDLHPNDAFEEANARARVGVARRVVDAANRSGRLLPMPEAYVREMVADWLGAGRAINGKWEVKEWYMAHSHRIYLHSDTRRLLSDILRRVP